MLVLEHADSFEPLAPEEQEQVELDFRATLMDPEGRRRHHPTKFEAAVPLLQAQNCCDRYDPGCVAQEMMIAPTAPPGWLGDAKGKGREHSLDPDDSISQVPPCNKQSQPGECLPDWMLVISFLFRSPIYGRRHAFATARFCAHVAATICEEPRGQIRW